MSTIESTDAAMECAKRIVTRMSIYMPRPTAVVEMEVCLEIEAFAAARLEDYRKSIGFPIYVYIPSWFDTDPNWAANALKLGCENAAAVAWQKANVEWKRELEKALRLEASNAEGAAQLVIKEMVIAVNELPLDTIV